MLHGTRSSFVFLLIKLNALNINKRTKSAASHALSFYQLDKQLLQRLYYLDYERNEFWKQSFVVFMNERFTRAPDEGSKIKLLYLNNGWLL